jgi:hypothetical protein
MTAAPVNAFRPSPFTLNPAHLLPAIGGGAMAHA